MRLNQQYPAYRKCDVPHARSIPQSEPSCVPAITTEDTETPLQAARKVANERIASRDLAPPLPPSMDDPGSAGGVLMNGTKFLFRNHPSVPREGGFPRIQWSSGSPRVFRPSPPKTPKRPSRRHGKWPTKESLRAIRPQLSRPSMDDPGFVGGMLMNGTKFIFSQSSFRAPRRRVSAPSVVVWGTARVPAITTEDTETPIQAARKAACERIRFARSGHNSPSFNG